MTSSNPMTNQSQSICEQYCTDIRLALGVMNVFGVRIYRMTTTHVNEAVNQTTNWVHSEARMLFLIESSEPA